MTYCFHLNIRGKDIVISTFITYHKIHGIVNICFSKSFAIGSNDHKSIA